MPRLPAAAGHEAAAEGLREVAQREDVAIVTSQLGASSSGYQMPEMNDSGRNVSWTTGWAWSADLTRLATATPSADRHAAPSSSVTTAGASVFA